MFNVSSTTKPWVVRQAGDVGALGDSVSGSAGAWVVTFAPPDDADTLSTRFTVWWGTDADTECNNGAIVDNDHLIGG